MSLPVKDAEYARLEPKERRERAFEALRNVLLLGSREKPLVLAVEDLHWIDKTSQEFLDYMIGLAPQHPDSADPSLPAGIHPSMGKQILLRQNRGGSTLPRHQRGTGEGHPSRGVKWRPNSGT